MLNLSIPKQARICSEVSHERNLYAPSVLTLLGLHFPASDIPEQGTYSVAEILETILNPFPKPLG